MATIHNVAKLAGVAPITVSRVINNSGYISDKTRKKVQVAISELGYVPNILARSLRSKRTNTLALVFTDITNPFFTILARGVEDTASIAGFNVIFCNTDESQEKEDNYIQLLLQKQVDGILLVPAGSNTRSIKVIQEQNTPLVILDRRVSHSNVDIVRGDSEGGAYQLTKYLIDLGHRHIAIISGPRNVSTAEDRLLGYKRAMEENGLKENIQSYYGRFTQACGNDLTRKIFSHDPKPTALFAANNLMAIGALRALRDIGFKVPDDVALVSFDDIPENLTAFPFMTVVTQPSYELGKRATELLISRIKNDSAPENQEIIFPVEFFERASSGGPLNDTKKRI
ncbi:MAG: LacI family DNA-binding transcriptional regulator [Pelolinea sp.]|nr:LacI family DNA-binding transcriptional regulator [Pelolinea sp.]